MIESALNEIAALLQHSWPGATGGENEVTAADEEAFNALGAVGGALDELFAKRPESERAVRVFATLIAFNVFREHLARKIRELK